VTVRVPFEPVAPPDTATGGGGGNMGSEAEFKANVQDAFFDYDSYELRPDAQAAAVKAASYLVSHPDIRIVVGGYCDERGSAEYNLALGENRANAAKTALTGAGVAPARIRVVSFGKEKQFCTEETEACWQENRRAQFLLDR
jgi:peptidoglycan-associated lipoprotein